MGVAKIKAALDQSNDVKAEPPKPLMRPAGEPEAFPMLALGDILGGAARAIVDKVQVPDAMAAQSVLAAASLASQGLVDIELPTGQRRPVSCFFITVAASGERKSASDNIATQPVVEREKELRRRFQVDREEYERKRDSYDVERRRILNKKSKSERERELDQLGPPPCRPVEPLLTCPEPTIEGLHRLLAEGQPSVGLFSDEGGQFIAGHGMSDENRLKTSAALSSLWDGDPVKRVRGGDGVVILPGRRVSMHLMAQPDAAARWLCDPVLADQGLLSRLLTVAPASLAGTRLWREPHPSGKGALQRYGARLHVLFQRPLPMADGAEEGLTPRLLTLSPDAAHAWQVYYNLIERQLGADAALRPIAGLANKLPEHAARLAAILGLVDDPDVQFVDVEKMEGGIKLAEHYASEALRLHGAAVTSVALKDAECLLDWMRTRWREPVISAVECYQKGPRRFRCKRQVEKLLAILEDHGWITPLEGAALVKGIRRREVWRIHGKDAA